LHELWDEIAIWVNPFNTVESLPPWGINMSPRRPLLQKAFSDTVFHEQYESLNPMKQQIRLKRNPGSPWKPYERLEASVFARRFTHGIARRIACSSLGKEAAF